MANIINRGLASTVVHLNATGTIDVSTLEAGFTGAYIAQVWWGASAGQSWTVDRTTTNILVLNESGHMDFAGNGCSLILEPTIDIVCTLSGGTGFIMFELQKVI